MHNCTTGIALYALCTNQLQHSMRGDTSDGIRVVMVLKLPVILYLLQFN